MRILLTRPRDQAAEMAAELRSMGHEVIVSPLLERQVLDVSDQLDGAGALVFTSVNGVTALEDATSEALQSVPVFAVGERTATAAAEAGFENIIVGPDRARNLLPLIDSFDGEIAGRIVHVSGEDVRTDVAAFLNAEGHPAERVVAYRMIAREGLSVEALSVLREGRMDAVLFFSPRSAELFVTLLEVEDMAAAVAGATAVALSAAVAEPLNRLDWTDIRIAARPDRRAMLARLEHKE